MTELARSFKRLSVAEARDALYIDFEGQKDKPPVFLGVLPDRLVDAASRGCLERARPESDSKVMAEYLGAVCQLPPGPTNQLATRFGVDPGWVTDIVDRLEARGQIVRRPSTEDRRVKILEVTESGRQTFEAMETMFATPPVELLDAPREDLLALVRIAERLAGPVSSGESQGGLTGSRRWLAGADASSVSSRRSHVEASAARVPPWAENGR